MGPPAEVNRTDALRSTPRKKGLSHPQQHGLWQSQCVAPWEIWAYGVSNFGLKLVDGMRYPIFTLICYIRDTVLKPWVLACFTASKTTRRSDPWHGRYAKLPRRTVGSYRCTDCYARNRMFARSPRLLHKMTFFFNRSRQSLRRVESYRETGNVAFYIVNSLS